MEDGRLWICVSGFESLPPSHRYNSHRARSVPRPQGSGHPKPTPQPARPCGAVNLGRVPAFLRVHRPAGWLSGVFNGEVCGYPHPSRAASIARPGGFDPCVFGVEREALTLRLV